MLQNFTDSRLAYSRYRLQTQSEYVFHCQLIRFPIHCSYFFQGAQDGGSFLGNNLFLYLLGEEINKFSRFCDVVDLDHFELIVYSGSQEGTR